MDRSTRNLSIITLLVVALFLVMNYVVNQSPLGDWLPVLILLLIALAIWGYDRLSYQEADEDEGFDTEIEPVTYERSVLLAAAPGAAYQQAEAPVEAAPIRAAAPATPAAGSSSAQTAEPEVAFQPPPMPNRPRPDVDTQHAPHSAVNERAKATLDNTPRDVIAEDKSEPAPPLPTPDDHPPAAATTTTTIEEKSQPPPSAPAPETDAEQAEHTPDGTWQPSVPKDDSQSRPETLSKPTEGVQLEPGTAARTPDPEVSASPLASGRGISASSLPMNADPTKPDDLKVIEGIGPKMEKALHAAGITTFAQLAGTNEATINAAILAAGMRFAPSVPTWAEQASYAANGDFVGLEAFQKTLKSGRKAK